VHPDPLGHHYLLDAWGVSASVLDDVDGLRGTLTAAATDAGATVVQTTFHRFAPHGVTGVVLLAESHVAVHTWPERGVAAVDVFTCGDPAIGGRVVAAVVKAWKPARHDVHHLARGVPSERA
jgi:S-adenosylmethionine decarboxylase